MILKADELCQLKTYDEKVAYIKALEDRLLKKYGIQDRDSMMSDELDDENYLRFRFEPYDVVSVNMYNGFWEIESAYRYSQYFSDDGTSTGVRNLFFSIARDLGCDDGYVCSEHCTWNGESLERMTFEDWIARMKERFGEMREYTPAQKYGEPEGDFPEVFHDDFAECKAEFQEVETKLGEMGYRANGIDRICGQFLTASKEGKTYIVDSSTWTLLLPDPVDYYQDMNTYAFEVMVGQKRVLFSSEGRKIFESDKGHFDWEWVVPEYHLDPLAVRIINKETGQETIVVTRREYQEELGVYYGYRRYEDAKHNILIPEYQL